MNEVKDNTNEWKGKNALRHFDALLLAIDNTVVLEQSSLAKNERLGYVRRATLGMSLGTREQVYERVLAEAERYVERRKALSFYTKRNIDSLADPTKNLNTTLPMRSRDGKQNEMTMPKNASRMAEYLEARNNL